jgi:hypothetical protein
MNNKNLLIGLGVAVVAYLLWKKNKDKTVTNAIVPLTEQEKNELFQDAVTKYQGGVAPSEEMLSNIKKRNDLAYAKIKELKLETELSTWLSNRPKVDYNAPLPQ